MAIVEEPDMPYLTYDEEYVDDVYKDDFESGDDAYDAFRQTQLDDEREEFWRNKRDALTEALADIGSGLSKEPWS